MMFRLQLIRMLVIVLLLGYNARINAIVNDFSELTSDGAWCWFADPRAVYYEGEKKQTYFAWVNSLGDIVVASYNHETNEFLKNTVHARLEVDDHDVPAIHIRDDGHILVFYSKHQAASPMYRLVSSQSEDISSFESKFSWGANVSYPNPFTINDEIVLIYRGLNWHPTIAESKDKGMTFGNERQLVLNGGARPYARYCQGADGAIHVAVTTGHPRNEHKNQIFYFKLKDNKFYRADGSLIRDFTTGINLGGSGNNSGVGSEAELVYDGVSNGRGWIWDLTVDPETQYPVMVYASMPTETDHRYNYAYWDGSQWVNKEITKSGSWFPQTAVGTTEREPHYSGGLSMDYNNPWRVYLSKQINGVFEIFKYDTKNRGDGWEITAITENTPADLVNVRPIVPRNHPEGWFDVLWMRGKYSYYYQGFHTALMFQMGARTDEISAIHLDKNELKMSVEGKAQLQVSLQPLIANTLLSWSSSDASVVQVENGNLEARAVGTATVTARTINGLEAQCVVTVSEREYLSEAFFDFGLTTSPVASGAIQITENSLIAGNSYGWLNPVIGRNRADGDAEKRDFNMFSTPEIFRVYVENGHYNVQVLQGDRDYMHDKMRIRVNGEIKADGVTAQRGEFVLSQFTTDVNNRLLDFEFSRHGTDPNWVVNAIWLKPNSTSVSENKPYMPELEDELMVYDMSGKFILYKKPNLISLKAFFADNQLDRGVYIVRVGLEKSGRVFKYIY